MRIPRTTITLAELMILFSEAGWEIATLLGRYRLGHPDSFLAVPLLSDGSRFSPLWAVLIRPRGLGQISIRPVEEWVRRKKESPLTFATRKDWPVAEALRFQNVVLNPIPFNAGRDRKTAKVWFDLLLVGEENRLAERIHGEAFTPTGRRMETGPDTRWL